MNPSFGRPQVDYGLTASFTEQSCDENQAGPAPTPQQKIHVTFHFENGSKTTVNTSGKTGVAKKIWRF